MFSDAGESLYEEEAYVRRMVATEDCEMVKLSVDELRALTAVRDTPRQQVSEPDR